MLKRLSVLLLVAAVLCSAQPSYGQSFGIELLNNMMPASGAMAGASSASPQDVQSAVYGNPSTLSQFQGTQFGFAGTWLEATYNLTVAPPGLPAFGVAPYDAKNDAQGVTAGNVALTQDFEAWGLPVTAGIGLFAGAGAGVDMRHVPASNGTHASIVALDITNSLAVQLTDRLSIGAAMHFSTATLDGPFVDITGSSADYGLRGVLGFDYALTPSTRVGTYYRSKTGYTFENLAGFAGIGFADVPVERPEVFGAGVSNDALLDGRLLLAVDVTYLAYTTTELLGAVYRDQWAVQFGTQYTINCKSKLRLGYAYNQNPMRANVPASIGGISPPGAEAHVQYIQSLFAAIPQHRVTTGISITDVLPGIDMDIFGGGALEEDQTFGLTTASVKAYWVGAGLTWHFGRGSCDRGDEGW